MSFDQRTLCCSVNLAVVVMCSAEMAIIIVAYLTNVEYPLMRCRSYNVSIAGNHHSSSTSQRRLCTANGTLVTWLIIHLFINLSALVAIQTSRYRALLPYIYTGVVDLLMASAYLVVLFVQLIRGEEIDKNLVLFIVAIVVFKAYSVFCSRRLYWILQSNFDRNSTTRTMIVKDESEFLI
ncbi:hypothetical protein DICVIV_08361 [Dictyocaulus viviparus]|uniref:Uncharacterized protein n=1 Tax=Dictyocaulus viviparus TaxID=29172 RepID=A0A0D8XT78_DICVI|nr:hypothetical protein DICVIV_08361 [Dictyocaulus viviparus]